MKRILCRPLAVAVLVLSLPVALVAGGGRPSEPPSALAILRHLNGRPRGTTQYRRVRLSLLNAGSLARSYVIRTLRTTGSGGSTTLFDLLEPEALRGTSFLLQEARPARVTGIRIWLRLPTGRSEPIEIEPSRARESLLGSDFAYQDWRLWWPAEDLRVRGLGTTLRHGRPAWEVEARPVSRELADRLGWGVVRLSVDRETAVLVRAEYALGAGDPPRRVFEATDLFQVDGIWIPRRMEIREPDTDRCTIVELLEAWHGRPVSIERLAPEHLAEVSAIFDRLQAGRALPTLDR